MADPIIEQVAAAVKTAVETVTTANGYTYTICEVTRETKAGWNPRHLSALVSQDFTEETFYEAGNGTLLTYPVVFSVIVAVMPPDDDQTSLDRYLNFLMADITKAVTENWDVKTPGTIGGLVYTWSVLAPIKFTPDAGGFDGIACNFIARIRVEETDPYTQR